MSTARALCSRINKAEQAQEGLLLPACQYYYAYYYPQPSGRLLRACRAT